MDTLIETKPKKGLAAMNNIAIVYILASVVAGAVGQILLKKGMSSMGPLTLSVDQLFGILWRIATNPYVVIGLFIYMCGTVFWLAALSRVDLSFAYPFTGLSYAAMVLASWLLFGENITLTRFAGMVVVWVGVFIISRT